MTTPDAARPFLALLEKLRAKYPAAPAAPTSPAAPVPPASPGAAAETSPDAASSPTPSSPAPCAAPLAPCSCHHDPVLREFVRSFLAWEAPLAKADAAMRRIDDAVVDVNEFRVSLPDEMAHIIGSSYPRVDERAQRLRAALNDIYRREHRLRLAHLADKPKREAKHYLESLANIPPFVAARVTLVSMGGHALPLDERTLAKLTAFGVLPPKTPLADAAALLERALRAGEAAEAHRLLQSWTDDPAATPPARALKPAAAKARKPAPRAAAKPTAKRKKTAAD